MAILTKWLMAALTKDVTLKWARRCFFCILCIAFDYWSCILQLQKKAVCNSSRAICGLVILILSNLSKGKILNDLDFYGPYFCIVTVMLVSAATASHDVEVTGVCPRWSCPCAGYRRHNLLFTKRQDPTSHFRRTVLYAATEALLHTENVLSRIVRIQHVLLFPCRIKVKQTKNKKTSIYWLDYITLVTVK